MGKAARMYASWSALVGLQEAADAEASMRTEENDRGQRRTSHSRVTQLLDPVTHWLGDPVTTPLTKMSNIARSELGEPNFSAVLLCASVNSPFEQRHVSLNRHAPTRAQIRIKYGHPTYNHSASDSTLSRCTSLPGTPKGEEGPT